MVELFLVPASAPPLVYQRLWYVLSCLWDDAYSLNVYEIYTYSLNVYEI